MKCTTPKPMTERRTSLARHIRDVRPMVQGKMRRSITWVQVPRNIISPPRHPTPPHPNPRNSGSHVNNVVGNPTPKRPRFQPDPATNKAVLMDLKGIWWVCNYWECEVQWDIYSTNINSQQCGMWLKLIAFLKEKLKCLCTLFSDKPLNIHGMSYNIPSINPRIGTSEKRVLKINLREFKSLQLQ